MYVLISTNFHLHFYHRVILKSYINFLPKYIQTYKWWHLNEVVDSSHHLCTVPHCCKFVKFPSFFLLDWSSNLYSGHVYSLIFYHSMASSWGGFSDIYLIGDLLDIFVSFLLLRDTSCSPWHVCIALAGSGGQMWASKVQSTPVPIRACA